MIDPAQLLSHPIVAVGLRAVLGGYVILMARAFYVDPMGFFLKSARWMPDNPRVRQIVRALSCFCLWGGCFIVATVVAVRIFGFHGDLLAVVLVTVAAIAAWLLLPKPPARDRQDLSQIENMRRPK